MLDGKKVLIVEDEVNMIESFKYKFKYKPIVKNVIPLYAKDIVEAENIITNESPDLIFLDLSLAEVIRLMVLKFLKNLQKVIIL